METREPKAGAGKRDSLKHTGIPTISYQDSLEEALCFGWIDSIRKTIDEQRYCHRFSPRRTNSKWSPLNISLAEKLIRQGTMTAAGLASFERRQAYEEEFLAGRGKKELALAPEIEEILKNNTIAWTNFRNLAPGYRKQYVGWLTSAKKPETRAKRLREAVRLLEHNKKLSMK